VNYVERHFGDWARDTSHLSMLEDGAYNRLCDLYYVRETPLPVDLQACCRLVRAASKPERDAVKSVLTEFFVLTDDGWRHRRCDAEIERFRTKSGKASASAKARWSADRSQSDGNANADANASTDAMRTHSEGNATRGGGRARSHSPLPNTQAIPSEAKASAADAAPLTAKDRLWALGVPLLGESSRGYIAKLAKTYGDELLAVVLAEATLERPIEPKAWVTAACEAKAKTRPKVNGNHAPQTTLDLLNRDPKAPWATEAGFPDIFAAESAGCGPGNYRQFRNGKRLDA
jgi:uncharacterized protein YdaU (DUF1376 family)